MNFFLIDNKTQGSTINNIVEEIIDESQNSIFHSIDVSVDNHVDLLDVDFNDPNTYVFKNDSSASNMIDINASVTVTTNSKSDQNQL